MPRRVDISKIRIQSTQPLFEENFQSSIKTNLHAPGVNFHSLPSNFPSLAPTEWVVVHTRVNDFIPRVEIAQAFSARKEEHRQRSDGLPMRLTSFQKLITPAH